MRNLAEAVLETLQEKFGDKLIQLTYADYFLKKEIIDFIKEEGEGFQLEGNYFGAFIEENQKIHYIHFGDDAPKYIELEVTEEYPVYYYGTDIVNYNRIVYKSEDGFYANYDHNRSFYFNFDNYPTEVVEEWNQEIN